jgi:hypothetical protein
MSASSLHILLTTAALLSAPSALAFSTPFHSKQTVHLTGQRQQQWGSSSPSHSHTHASPSSSTRLYSDIDEVTTAGVNAIDTFYQTQPYLSAFITCSVKAGTADVIAQTQLNQPDEESEDGANANGTVLNSSSSKSISSTSDDSSSGTGIDVSRNLAFIFYGGLYSGLAQQFFYTVAFPGWFGHVQDWQTVAKEVGMDMLVIGPFLCLPIAYMVKTAFTADEFNLENIKIGLEKYVEDVKIRGLLLKYWAVWIPGQTVTFTIIPEHLRIPFVAAVSFFWMFILSSTSASTADPSASTEA